MKKLLLIIFILLTPSLASAATIGKVNANNIGLVGYWTFDGTDMKSNVHDRSGNGYDLFLRNTFPLASGWTIPTSTGLAPGHIGQALRSFSNATNFIATTSSTVFDMTINNAITVSVWLDPTAVQSAWIIHYTSNCTNSSDGFAQWVLGTDSTGHYRFYLGNGNITFNAATNGSVLSPNKWALVTGVIDANNVYLYVNSVLVATTARSVTPGTANGLYISGQCNLTTKTFSGLIDETRIYNRALSATEVAALYNSSTKVGVTTASPSASTTPLSNGLVGYWTLDGSKTNWATGKTFDSAGVNTGQLINMSTTTAPALGRVGQAFKFDGSDDVISTASDIVGVGAITACAWFFPISLGENSLARIFDSGSFQFLFVSPSVIRISSDGGGTVMDSNSFGSFSVWHHVCFTRNSSGLGSVYLEGLLSGAANRSSGTPVSGSALTIGNRAALDRTFDGYLDDVRVYNRALSANEVSQLYNSGSAKIGRSGAASGTTTAPLSNGLVGYWTLDGSKTNWTTGKTLDSSGQGNTGQLIGMSTSTSPAIGKVGQAFNFGSSSLVNLGDVLNNTFPISFSMWVNPTARGTFGGIFATDRTLDFSNYIGAWVQYDNTGTVSLTYGDNTGCSTANRRTKGSANTVLPLNQWTHITGVIRGPTDMSIYINGVDDGGVYSGGGGSMVSNSNVAFIGAMSDCAGPPKFYFPGKIDDVRVYNKSLSAQEVKQLYNATK